jgi:hypothetical protein
MGSKRVLEFKIIGYFLKGFCPLFYRLPAFGRQSVALKNGLFPVNNRQTAWGGQAAILLLWAQ